MKVVHVGFPKTATTFLQERVFPQFCRRLTYLGPDLSAPLFASVINRDDTVFDFEDSKKRIEAAWGGNENALFSYEPLTGLDYRSAFVNRTQIAQRLKKLGFERVIITIRNQFDALESAYKQYVKSGGVLKFFEYVTFDPGKPKYLYPEYFDYYSIYRLYAETFGAPNVLILQYERLREDTFVEDLLEFLRIGRMEVAFGEPRNQSLSCTKTKILRLLNHLAYSAYQPSHLISKRISTSFFHRLLSDIPLWNAPQSFLDSEYRAAIGSYYASSNEELRKRARIILAPSYP